ncbi:zinc finger domain-containing protein type domain containing protein [Ophiocordyceps sinensis CO18]|uniref:Zinc finger domain-containing protein type domain containing protein n=1 Tax=Ophiocordyceps sinensis (strain Co18 / CGMCC 3.14243) TaxID=911162 RepID=T5A4C1_OPHSC|nr:zinc finger domain-containing protein type domain containing protein [Ophiocordyceps sinensis CO18]
MASQQPSDTASPRSGGYRGASRRGAPRRFACHHSGCGKVYSRAEHLQRHQLNHAPKQIFRCDIGDCDQKFVRPDLLARHKRRHTASYTPRNRLPSFDVGGDGTSVKMGRCESHAQPRSVAQTASTGPHDADILPTSDTNPAPPPLHHTHPVVTPRGALWTSSIDGRGPGSLMPVPRQSLYRGHAPPMQEPAAAVSYNVAYSTDNQLAPENFATWLFDPQSTYTDLSVAHIPFLEGGLESTLNNKIKYDYESLNSHSPAEQGTRHSDSSDAWITEARRQELLHWFRIFRNKQPQYEPSMVNLIHESGGDLPALNLDMMHDCLNEFWDKVSPRLPVVHQHTFSAKDCPVLLLLVMISLGAASLRGRDTIGQLSEYGTFADVIISSVRWEILTSDDAAPPIGLWVAQALLLLEFYEKLCSSRKLHERAHIYHPAFLTLLRRGSPLIGRTGSESPTDDELPAAERNVSDMPLDLQSWWVRWAERESMHRVVFGAFMLDIIHAAMFGHTADMAAHEIRLPLPCDDNLWKASSPDVVRQLDANCGLYGFEQVSFLDGLKSALHGKEVKTHAFGRMIVISGLLSVGWHLSHKEAHLKWLDLRTPSAGTQDGWRKMLLRALGNWKRSFDVAMSESVAEPSGNGPVSNGPIGSASLLFHLVHISLHTDIVDCQVYAGAKRLLGRKVSSRDYANAVKRMSSWAKQASTRHAVLHAFKLLHCVLVEPHPRRRTSLDDAQPVAIQYSLRNETDPHRPWIMYYAVLVIWAFVQAVGRPPGKGFPLRPSQMAHSTYARMAEYLSAVAGLSDLDEATAAALHEGLPELLDAMEGILEEADTELLREARERLSVCKDMLLGGSRGADGSQVAVSYMRKEGESEGS